MASAAEAVVLVEEVHPVAGDPDFHDGRPAAEHARVRRERQGAEVAQNERVSDTPRTKAGGAGFSSSASRGLGAWWRHSGLAPDPVLRAFDEAAFQRIEAAIDAGEQRHRGEICFAIESALGWRSLRQGLSARERALQVFGEQRVWDTEENTGILIYLLTADRAVEIIADRRVHQLLPADIWQQACQRVVGAGIGGGNKVEGVLAAIELLNQALAEFLPAEPGDRNPDELENRPVRL